MCSVATHPIPVPGAARIAALPLLTVSIGDIFIQQRETRFSFIFWKHFIAPPQRARYLSRSSPPKPSRPIPRGFFPEVLPLLFSCSFPGYDLPPPQLPEFLTSGSFLAWMAPDVVHSSSQNINTPPGVFIEWLTSPYHRSHV